MLAQSNGADQPWIDPEPQHKKTQAETTKAQRMIGLNTPNIVPELVSNFVVRRGGIGITLVVVGGLIVDRTSAVQVLRGGTQCTMKAFLQLMIGTGMALFGALLIYQSFTLQLPSPV
ncbi:hypothetical protein [Halocatena pleomorpha]|uniref:Uncharacterized protein n=1 Tax=Halocatena pleomorpha TaxID=1785090 RepID=A0A3P3RD42_9EURY|nr:hypothetical protein [Halocatena pleomorpha]RRJ31412.1 hypothetical protein EIK79_06745 [Halocatena pleomorpha]